MASAFLDDDLLAGGALLLALGAVVVAVVRDGGRRVINIPSDFGQTDESNPVDETAPDDLQEPGGTGSNDWEYQEPSDNPNNNDESLDFGDSTPGAPSPTAPSIPDSLSGFDPAGRVDLINDGNQVGL